MGGLGRGGDPTAPVDKAATQDIWGEGQELKGDQGPGGSHPVLKAGDKRAKGTRDKAASPGAGNPQDSFSPRPSCVLGWEGTTGRSSRNKCGLAGASFARAQAGRNGSQNVQKSGEASTGRNTDRASNQSRLHLEGQRQPRNLSVGPRSREGTDTGEGLLFLRSQERRHRQLGRELGALCLEETEDRVGVGRPRGHRREASRGQELTGGWGLS